jgi:hypothetical protein
VDRTAAVFSRDPGVVRSDPLPRSNAEELATEGRKSAPACSLVQRDLVVRHERWLHLCDHALSAKEPTHRGMKLRFRRLKHVEVELRQLAKLERDCCSFAAWSVVREGTDVVLEVSAYGDAAVAARALFDEIPAPG